MNNAQASRATLTCKCHVRRCPRCDACARCGCDHDGFSVEWKLRRGRGRPRKEEIQAHQHYRDPRVENLHCLGDGEQVPHGQSQKLCRDAEAIESERRFARRAGAQVANEGTEKRRKINEKGRENEGAPTVRGRESSEDGNTYLNSPGFPAPREAQNVWSAVSVGWTAEPQAPLGMEEVQGAKSHIRSLLAAARWVVSHPCCELRKSYEVDVDEAKWKALEHKIPEIERYGEQLEPVWSVISTGLGPILLAKEVYEYVDELFAHRDQWDWLIGGIRGRNSEAMRMIDKMVNVLLKSDSTWSKKNAQKQARTLKIWMYNEMGWNLFPKLSKIVYDEALNEILGGERSMLALTKRLQTHRTSCRLSRQFYKDIVYKLITDMGWSVVRDSSNMVKLLSKGQARARKLRRDVVINNEDEVGNADVAALLPYWFTIDGTQLCFTDGVVAYEGRVYHEGSTMFIPKLTEEALQRSIIERSLLLPFVPGNWRGDPSPHLSSINIEALKFFWQLRMTGRVKDFAGVDFTHINSPSLDDPRVFDDPTLSREAIRIMMTPYVEALRELCPSSVRRMNLYHSLRLLRKYKGNAKGVILKAFAERNLQLLGYRGLVIEFDGHERSSRSRRRLVLRRYTPRNLEELLDNAGIRLEFFINDRSSETIRSVMEVCNYVSEDGKLDPWVPLILDDLIGQITRWDVRNLTESNYLRKIPPVPHNENALTKHPRPSCDPFWSKVTQIFERFAQVQDESNDEVFATLCSVEESQLLKLLTNNSENF